jgi:hypothetical protein
MPWSSQSTENLALSSSFVIVNGTSSHVFNEIRVETRLPYRRPDSEDRPSDGTGKTQEQEEMHDLARLAINAHEGLDRWHKLRRVSARFVNEGVLWTLKGKQDVIQDLHVTVDLHREWASHWPFSQRAQHTSFQPDHVAIETADGTISEERSNPRDWFRGHTLETPWDNLTTQTFYFSQQGLLQRRDYDVEVYGGIPAAHYVSELRQFSGITVPTKRRVYERVPDGRAVLDPLIVSIDLSEVRFE